MTIFGLVFFLIARIVLDKLVSNVRKQVHDKFSIFLQKVARATVTQLLINKQCVKK